MRITIAGGVAILSVLLPPTAQRVFAGTQPRPETRESEGGRVDRGARSFGSPSNNKPRSLIRASGSFIVHRLLEAKSRDDVLVIVIDKAALLPAC